MNKCDRCRKPLDEMTFDQVLAAHEQYRKNFPQTYDLELPALICDECYHYLINQHPPQEWEKQWDDDYGKNTV